MLNQYKNFNVKKFTENFNPYINTVNGFDIYVMQSHEEADNLIQKIKNIIDIYASIPNQTINLEYDDSNLLELDKKRVKQAINQYINLKSNLMRFV